MQRSPLSASKIEYLGANETRCKMSLQRGRSGKIKRVIRSSQGRPESMPAQLNVSNSAMNSCVSLWRGSRWIMGRASSCDSLIFTLELK